MANLNTIVSGASVTLTVAEQQSIVLNNGRSDVARLSITTGPGAGRVVTTSHNGRREYGPFSAGTITLVAVSGDCRYELSGDATSPLDDDGQPLTPAENQTVRAASQVLVQTGIPFILGSNGSITDNGGFGGQVTYVTALPVAYGWSYCYFPVGAIVSGSAAGWWLTNMTSTTVGTIYNVQYAGGQPSIPINPTGSARFATGSPGSFSQTIGASDINAITAVIPASAMGPNGAIEWDQKRNCPTSASVKQFSTLFGGQTVCGHTATTTQLISGANGTIHNRGVENLQTSVQASFGDAASGSIRRQTVDTTASQVFAHTMYITSALDYAVLEGASVILRPKA